MRFDVIDTGVGIPAGRQESVLDAFTQVRDAGNYRGSGTLGGTGLGLTICRRLAAMLEAELTLTSVVEEGSTFSLRYLPRVFDVMCLAPNLDLEWAVDERGEERRTAAALAGRHVLLVDDNPDNRRIVGFLLEHGEATHVEAANGAAALELAAEARRSGRPFDLVLMDMQMPVLNGFDATRALRNAGDDTPILAMTAYAMSGDRDRCQQAGCDGYISKPIVPRDFYATISRNLRQTTDRAVAKNAATELEQKWSRLPASVTATPASGQSVKLQEAGDSAEKDDGRSMASLMQQNPVIRRLAEEYVQDLPEQAQVIRAAGESGDRETLLTASHRMKGTAANFGQPRLSKLAAAVEARLRADHTDSAVQEVAALLEAIEGVTQRRKSA